MYAYTDSEMHKAVLRLFIKEEYQYPNLVVGALTRESLKEAFNKKIRARDIMKFIRAHAHP